MEDPAQDIKNVLQALTQGTPEAQHDAIYRYFAPGAAFEHPFCWVPSFKNLNVPFVGEIDSRILIAAIYRWYKILSPKIELELESCVYDERANLLYLTIFQVFSIWFIPFHRAPVRLVTVLHLTPAHAGDGTPPPTYDAAQEKLQAVLEGNEPSYAAVAGGSAGSQTQRKKKEGDSKPSPTSDAASKATGSGSDSGSSSSTASTRYLIKTQKDLYQVNEFFKFVTLTPLLPIIIGFLQVLATLACWAGETTLGPVMNFVWPAKGKEKA